MKPMSGRILRIFASISHVYPLELAKNLILFLVILIVLPVIAERTRKRRRTKTCGRWQFRAPVIFARQAGIEFWALGFQAGGQPVTHEDVQQVAPLVAGAADFLTEQVRVRVAAAGLETRRVA